MKSTGCYPPPHRRVSASGGISVFLKDVVLTLLVSLLAIAPFEYACGKGENEYSKKYKYVTEDSDKIKTLVLGNSFLLHGLDLNVIGDSSFCCASDSRTISIDAMLAERIIPRMNNLKVVIMPMTHSFSVKMKGKLPILRNRMFMLCRYMDLPSRGFPANIQCRSALLSGAFELSSCRKDTANIGNGFRAIGRIWDGVGDENKTYPLPQCPRDEYIEELSKIAKVCAENAVRLIVVAPPFSNLHVAKATPESIANLDSVAEMVKGHYPIEYKNYMVDEEFRSDSLYCDENHLNGFGATLFAQRVKADFGL